MLYACAVVLRLNVVQYCVDHWLNCCSVSIVSRTSQSTPLSRVVSNNITSGSEGGISRGKYRVFSLLRTYQATMSGAIAGRLELFGLEVESI